MQIGVCVCGVWCVVGGVCVCVCVACVRACVCVCVCACVRVCKITAVSLNVFWPFSNLPISCQTYVQSRETVTY